MVSSMENPTLAKVMASFHVSVQCGHGIFYCCFNLSLCHGDKSPSLPFNTESLATVKKITKTYLYTDPLRPHFYTVKLGFIGVYIIFLISTKNIARRF